MGKEFIDMTPPEKVEFIKNEIRKIVDWAKESIQEELSRKANNWTSCFKTISGSMDDNRSTARSYLDENEYNKINEKIESLKIEIWNLWEKYTKKDQEPTDEEKENLFQHLSEIKTMIPE
jgi:hypothetical protein